MHKCENCGREFTKAALRYTRVPDSWSLPREFRTDDHVIGWAYLCLDCRTLVKAVRA